MDKVYCPWCGREMKLEESLPFSGVFAYVCECGAVSPNENGVEEALKAALKRPLQKPLTLEEVEEQVAVWKDDRQTYGDNPIPTLRVYTDEVVTCFDDGFGEQNYFGNDKYSKTWRCWATKPTDEERKAAKWDE